VLQSYLEFLGKQWEALPTTPPETLAKDLVSRILMMRDQRLQEEVASLRFLQVEAGESHNKEQQLHYQRLVEPAKEQLRSIQYAVDRRSILGRRRAEEERYGTIQI
jgi:hypothetical protein